MDDEWEKNKSYNFNDEDEETRQLKKEQAEILGIAQERDKKNDAMNTKNQNDFTKLKQ